MDNLIEKIKEYVMEECRKYKEASGEHYHKKKRPIFMFSRQIQAEKVVKDIR